MSDRPSKYSAMSVALPYAELQCSQLWVSLRKSFTWEFGWRGQAYPKSSHAETRDYPNTEVIRS